MRLDPRVDDGSMVSGFILIPVAILITVTVAGPGTVGIAGLAGVLALVVVAAPVSSSQHGPALLVARP